MPSLPPTIRHVIKQTQQYLQASWRWKRLEFDSLAIFGKWFHLGVR